jgi:hypothetical protein
MSRTKRRRRRNVMRPRTLLLALTTAALGTTLLGPLQASAASTCVVENVRTGRSSGTLGEAVAAATTGDTLNVSGTCEGATTLDKNLTIAGQIPKGFARPRLQLKTSERGSVVSVNAGVTATITSLTISGGTGSEDPTFGNGIAGGGVRNDGSLTLEDSTVSQNTSPELEAGAGLFNGHRASLTLTNSLVSGNRTSTNPELPSQGAGITDYEGSLTLNYTTVRGNTAGGGGGGIKCVRGFPAVTLNHSTVTENTAGLAGGGIDNSRCTQMTLTNSTVSGNTAGGAGGIFGEEGTLTLTNSTVSGNKANFTAPLHANGGGIFYTDGSVTLSGSSSVEGNTAENGAGIFSSVKNSVVLEDSSSVNGNKASGEGGGIFNLASGGATLSFGLGWNGTVSGNKPDDIFNCVSGLCGAGG